MSETVLYRLWMIPGAAALLAAGIFFLRLDEENLSKFEPLPRNRVFGMISGWFALIWCIPHAEAVAPGFLLPFLWPLALIVPVVSFFCLDYMTARAVGGLLIILAYEALHRAFDLALPLAGVVAVLSWLLGACGIWISGIPYHLRDAIRLAARKPVMRFLFGLSLIVCGLVFLVSGIFEI
ncbi:MAG: hypothetical protein IJS01_08675 [Lentisphaeria bacterium]|nr:hypothetical protein [Lentisphaeria bacterium]